MKGTISGLLLLMVIFGAILTSGSVSASDVEINDVSIAVPVSCNISSVLNEAHNATIIPGRNVADIGTTTFTTLCNDTSGYSIYAIGYSNQEYGNTKLLATIGGTLAPSEDIITGTATNGNTSNWSMKLASVAGTSAPTILSDTNGSFASYHVVPTTYTKVATFSTVVDATVGSKLTTTYQAYIDGTKPSGTYSGKVKYILLHPNNSCMYYSIQFNAGDGSGTMENQKICRDTATNLSTSTLTPPSGYEFLEWNTAADGSGTSYSENASVTNLATAGETVVLYAIYHNPNSLYNTVANLVKKDGNGNPRTQAAADLKATITLPTTYDPSTDTSNSGVYLYDASIFGTSSDASNDYPIYYYRGILDRYVTSGSYGSGGSSNVYPNYVKLGNNTCWRIIRTTGSGGVKMIYNGVYSSGTCAKTSTDAQVITSSFNSSTASNGYTSISENNAHAVGYTYNSAMNSVTANTEIGTVFGGSSGSFSHNVNSSDSIIKKYIEQTWYPNNMTSYSSILEPSAGYCNDRSLYSSIYSSAMSESATIKPYGTSGMTEYDFGGAVRNIFSQQEPSLTCPRGRVDIYTTNSATDGNNQLSYPVALLTADESTFAGSGKETISSYSQYAYLDTGSTFWMLSPSNRGSYGTAKVIALVWDELNYNQYANSSKGIRPVISLVHSVSVVSGSGTATDPWLISE